MFFNISDKLKSLAKILVFLGIILILILIIGFFIWSFGKSQSKSGTLSDINSATAYVEATKKIATGKSMMTYGAIGGAVSIIGAYLVYGFGELIAEVCSIRRQIGLMKKNSDDLTVTTKNIKGQIENIKDNITEKNN